MGDADELLRLREEVKRLLSDALSVERRHDDELARRNHRHEAAMDAQAATYAADVERREAAHVADMARRDELHVAETARRDELHVGEVDRRDQLHETELLRRDEIHEHELELIRTALESRDTIGQAKGVIIAALQCSSDEAFALIRTQSQHENRKLTEVAMEIVQRATRRPPERGKLPDGQDRQGG